MNQHPENEPDGANLQDVAPQHEMPFSQIMRLIRLFHDSPGMFRDRNIQGRYECVRRRQQGLIGQLPLLAEDLVAMAAFLQDLAPALLDGVEMMPVPAPIDVDDDQQPPIADEVPAPVDDQQPLIADEVPAPVDDQQPPIADEVPAPVDDQQPPIVDEVPAPVDDQQLGDVEPRDVYGDGHVGTRINVKSEYSRRIATTPRTVVATELDALTNAFKDEVVEFICGRSGARRDLSSSNTSYWLDIREPNAPVDLTLSVAQFRMKVLTSGKIVVVFACGSTTRLYRLERGDDGHVGWNLKRHYIDPENPRCLPYLNENPHIPSTPVFVAMTQGTYCVQVESNLNYVYDSMTFEIE